ncbi:MAG: GNAT family N-acetyltransferase [Ilumatobacter sp.]
MTDGVQIDIIDDAAKGLDVCGDLFRAEPIRSTPVTTSLYPGRASALIRVSDGADTIGVAAEEAEGYTLAPLKPGAAMALADVLPVDRPLTVLGAAGDVATLAGRWSERCDGAIDTGQLYRWYRLDEATEQKKRKGALRVGDRSSTDRAAAWMSAFGIDVGLPLSNEAVQARVGDAINEGRLFEWVLGDEVVSQLIISPARFGVVRINGVYTSPELRKDGHSSAITAAVAMQQIARQKVDHVALDQPASTGVTNRMYRRLGFESVWDTLAVRLIPPRR